MGFGVKLKVWGSYACFTRPEMKVERVSYDVMTPSAARGVLEAIYWKPSICWVVDKIHVMNPVKFDNIMRNEVLGKIPSTSVKSAFNGNKMNLYKDPNDHRVQKHSVVLRDVCYYIEAHFNLLNQEETEEKHYNMVIRRMRKGQCFHHPYFGCREFPVQFEFVEDDIPKSDMGNKDLGLMLWDIDFSQPDKKCIFFKAIMDNGIIDVTNCYNNGAFS